MKVLEIGAGASPFLTDRDVTINNIEYYISDIDDELLGRASVSNAIAIIGDLTDKPFNQKFDLIFSKMVLEHLPSPMAFHKNILSMVTEQTIVCHFFATKYGVPSLLNMMLPDKVSDAIVYKLQKRDQEMEGKFKAYYRSCWGPTHKSQEYFKNLGFNIVSYAGYLGSGYLSRFPFWGRFEKLYSKALLKFNLPILTSNAILILRKQTYD